MAQRECEYCEDPQNAFKSTGDVTLAFSSGRAWIMPTMILHYLEEHQWRAPSSFIDDVLNSSLHPPKANDPRQVKPARVGYLKGYFEAGSNPPGFASRLAALIKQTQAAEERAAQPVSP